MALASTVTLLSFDAAYLRALHRGDPETEHHFYQYFAPLIRARLRKYLRSPDLIKDAMQETFTRVLTAVRARDGVRHPERFGAFVHAVSRNVALEMLRWERHFVALEDEDSNAHQQLKWEPDPFRSPLASAEAGEAREGVRQVLAELSPFDRQLLVEIFLYEEDRGLICRRLGISRAHLRILLFRARQRFVELAMVDSGGMQGGKPRAGKSRMMRK